MMVLVYGMPGFVRMARAASIPLDEPVGITEVVGRFAEPAPPITITRAEYDEAMAALSPLISVPNGDGEEGWRRFAWVRSSYEPAAARRSPDSRSPTPAPWTTDRPASVGEPRFLSRRKIRVDWTANVPAAATAAGASPGPGASASPTGG